MGLFFNWEFRGGGVPAATDDFWWSDIGAYRESSSGVRVTEEGALKFIVLASCVALKARTLAGMRCYVAKVKPGSNQYEEIPDHPLNILLQSRPNPDTNEYNFFETVVHHVDLWGNFYATINRNSIGDVTRLWQIADPDRVTVKIAKKQTRMDDNTSITAGGIYYEINANISTPQKIAPKKMLHIPNFSQNGITGLSQIQIYRDAVGLGLASQDYQGKIYKNGSGRGGVVHFESWLEENRDFMQRSLNKQFGDLNRGDSPVVILEDAATYTPLSMPQRDAQFVESQDWNAKTICGWFGVPPHKVGLEASTAYGSIEAQNSDFRTDCIWPLGIRVGQAMGNRLFTPSELAQGLRIVFDYDAFFRADKVATATYYRKMFEMGMPGNTIMAKEGLPGVGPQGDLSFRPANLVFMDQEVGNTATNAGTSNGQTNDDTQEDLA